MTGNTDRPEPAPEPKPDGYNPREYPAFAVTVDIVILTVTGGELQVLLIERGSEPYLGRWALPGGFKKPDETLDQAARRELFEETGVNVPEPELGTAASLGEAALTRRVEPSGRRVALSQFGAYGDPGRDPRMNVVTVAYLAVLPSVGELRSGTDARSARMFPVRAVRGGDPPLAFDHQRILADAVERVGNDLGTTDLATAFVGPEFTLSELQSVYEQVWDEPLDPANFRRSLLSAPPQPPEPMNAPQDNLHATRNLDAHLGLQSMQLFLRSARAMPDDALMVSGVSDRIQEVAWKLAGPREREEESAPAVYVEPLGPDKVVRSGPRGGRPAQLFRAGAAWRSGSPVKRPSSTKRSPRQPDDKNE